MDAPEELRQAIATAIGDADCTTDNMTVAELDAAYLIHADAVLAVPAIADALRDAARLRSLAAQYDLFDRQSFTGAQVAAMLRDGKE